MNFDDAIAAHSQWKRKLRAYLAKPDRSLKASDAAANDKCELGKWLAGEGRKYSMMPEFAKLVAEHTRFHKAAAGVITRADGGQDTSGEIALGANSEFGQASTNVVLALVEMKAKG